jgi:hypothetical protein
VPDLGSLRSLGSQVQPPPLELLEDVARRRARVAAMLATTGGVAAVTIALVLLVVLPREGRAVPEPVQTPTPTVTRSPTRTATEEPGGPATHASDTSMTPREVVTKPNAELLMTGLSADDPNFRVSLWRARCTWCPNDDELRGRPLFSAMAITTDGFRTVTYRRVPSEMTDFAYHVESPAPGLLLFVDAGNSVQNSPEWLLRDDGTLTELQAVVGDRAEADPRRWHRCAGFEDDPYDNQDPRGWCALAARENTSYQPGAPWLADFFVRGGSAVSPAESDAPWGVQNEDRLVPFWYENGVLRTRDFGPADARGTVTGMPRGEMGVWALDRRSSLLAVWTSGDAGHSWQVRRLAVPTWPSRWLTVHRTSSGALLVLDEGRQDLYVWPPRAIWRAGPGADAFEVEYAESERTDIPGYGGAAFAEVDGRIWSGGLWSDDDGRTWNAIDVWR